MCQNQHPNQNTDESSVEDLKRQVRHLKRLVELSRALSSTLALEPLLQTIINTATELTTTEASSILLLEPGSDHLSFSAATGTCSKQVSSIAVPVDGSIAGWVVRHGRPLIVPSAPQDPRFCSQVDEATSFTTLAILAVPLQSALNGQSRIIGALEVINKRDNATFSDWDVEVLSTLAAQAAVAIENAHLLEALQTAYTELSELDRHKSEFIAITSHELRTPLTLIFAYATFLQEQAEGAAQQQIDMVLESANRLQELINDLTDLRYLETGQEPPRLKPRSLDALLRESIPEFDALASSKGLALKLHLPDQPIVITGDPYKLKVVIGNLVANAIKFTPAGGTIDVRAWTDQENGYARVKDTGIGIPPEEQEQIFEQFHQVEPILTRRFSGTGLGLPLARGLVEQHGGSLWVESAPSQGSTFTFNIPLADPQPHP